MQLRALIPVLSVALLAVHKVSTATVTFDCARVPNICSNDCFAIQCSGKPTTLHRDSANADENRDETACRSPNRCSGNPSDSNSCDEYPFASSREGGTGSVTRCVPSSENSSQGGTLSSFYTNNGVQDGDAYNVAFKGGSTLQYCNGNCVNTGNQVIRRYPLATQHKRREFETEEGDVLVMFERVADPGHLDSVVGTDTWLAHEHRHVKIVKALS